MELYFINEEARIIFGLVELEAKTQMDFLGINYLHYSSKSVAKKWYEAIKRKIENSEHPKKNVALENLEKIYKGMW